MHTANLYYSFSLKQALKKLQNKLLIMPFLGLSAHIIQTGSVHKVKENIIINFKMNNILLPQQIKRGHVIVTQNKLE
jgi:hypothetical protein